jgi:hypothetical protein
MLVVERNPETEVPDNGYPRLRMFDGDHEVVDRGAWGLRVEQQVMVELWAEHDDPAQLGAALSTLHAQLIRLCGENPLLGGLCETIREESFTVALASDAFTHPTAVGTATLVIEFEAPRAALLTARRVAVLDAFEDLLRTGLPASLGSTVRERAIAALYNALEAALPTVYVTRNPIRAHALDQEPLAVLVTDGPHVVDHDLGTGGVGYRIEVAIDCLATAATEDELGTAVASLADQVGAVVDADPTLGGMAIDVQELDGVSEATALDFVRPAMLVTVGVTILVAVDDSNPNLAAFYQAAA